VSHICSQHFLTLLSKLLEGGRAEAQGEAELVEEGVAARAEGVDSPAAEAGHAAAAELDRAVAVAAPDRVRVEEAEEVDPVEPIPPAVQVAEGVAEIRADLIERLTISLSKRVR
jgi:hypothetical protein